LSLTSTLIYIFMARIQRPSLQSPVTSCYLVIAMTLLKTWV
jgi:hypothetical protein